MVMSGFHPAISREFTMDDQMAFAQVSGDFNPLHVDAAAARRLTFGEPVVHGVHALLWALDCLTAAAPGMKAIVHLKSTFSAPIRVDERVTLNWERSGDSEANATIANATDNCIQLSIRWNDQVLSDVAVANEIPQGECKDLDVDSIESAYGAVPLVFPREPAARLFSNLLKRLPAVQLAAILATTRVVGMECPGLHSLFFGLDLAFDESGGLPELSYRVERWGALFKMLDIAVAGPGVSGRLNCFLRPGPAQQADMKEAVSLVTAGEFGDQKALVIGGSRGLGEITAKIVAAGGGDVVLTYRADTGDAGRVIDDISAHGGHVRAIALDVLEAKPKLADTGAPFTHVYYFASPKIVPTQRNGFDGNLFVEYCRYYLLGVATVLASLDSHVDPAFTFYYPSTVFIDEGSPKFSEYVAAKSLGETMGNQLAMMFPDARFAVTRLPRLATDQTQSMMPVNADNPLPLMLKEVRKNYSWNR
jgi:acyl dehydratase